MDAPKPLFLGLKPEKPVIRVNGRHIPVFLDGAQADVGHADFLALIDKGRSLLENVRRRQHGAGFPPEAFAAVPADDPRDYCICDGVFYIKQLDETEDGDAHEKWPDSVRHQQKAAAERYSDDSPDLFDFHAQRLLSVQQHHPVLTTLSCIATIPLWVMVYEALAG